MRPGSTRGCWTGSSSPRSAWPGSRRTCARSPRCRTPSARRSRVTGFPTGSTCGACACHSAWWRWSTRPRPNVTVDCSALCLKSGNAIVLRGSSTAAHSNAVLAQVASSAVQWAGVPEGAISIVSGGDRDELRQLATQDGVVDLIIPRGGDGLKNALKEHATVPVLYAAAGVCHLLVDASADMDDAVAIALNAKVQRPSVCNAIETLLVHSEAAADFLPRALGRAARVGRGAPCGRSHARACRQHRRLARGGDRRGLGDRVPRADPVREGDRLARRGHRAHQPLRHGPLGGDRDGLDAVRPRRSRPAWTRRRCT